MKKKTNLPITVTALILVLVSGYFLIFNPTEEIKFSVLALIFIISSLVLILNNLTDVFKKYRKKFPVNLTAWVGIIFAVVWFVLILAWRA